MDSDGINSVHILQCIYAHKSIAESDSAYETPHKRQRLSSPTYDDQFVMSQEEVAAFDVFNRRLSQTRASPMRPSQSLSPQSKRKRSHAIAEALGLKRDDPDDGQCSK